jgi:hypothetical protein
MPHASKIKGNSNERDVAKLLSPWWGEEFQRTPNSGALRWNGSTWTYGDLLPPETFPAVVECKHYKAINTDGILHLKPGADNILGWWLEVQADSQRCYQETGRVVQPLLIYKANRVPRRIALEADFFTALGGRRLGLPSLWVTHPEMPGPFVLLDFEKFLSTVGRVEFLDAQRKVLPTALVELAA